MCEYPTPGTSRSVRSLGMPPRGSSEPGFSVLIYKIPGLCGGLTLCRRSAGSAGVDPQDDGMNDRPPEFEVDSHRVEAEIFRGHGAGAVAVRHPAERRVHHDRDDVRTHPHPAFCPGVPRLPGAGGTFPDVAVRDAEGGQDGIDAPVDGDCGADACGGRGFVSPGGTVTGTCKKQGQRAEREQKRGDDTYNRRGARVGHVRAKTGFRFSRNAAVPSRKSPVPQSSPNSPASTLSPSLSGSSQAALRAFSDIRTASCPFPAIVRARAAASPGRSAFGTTLLTRPIRSASAASTWAPVRIISQALPGPTRRASRWVPPYPGMIPRLTSGWPNLALSEAILM